MDAALLPAVDPASGVPLHRQVYDGLRVAILTGRLRPGERLPATRTLAGELGLSRTTVAEAYDQLQAEGYVRGRHGSGTYVSPDLPAGGLPMPLSDQPHRHRLSAWGQQITEAETSGVGADYRSEAGRHSGGPLRKNASIGAAEAYRYDFRPGRIASDLFPWDAWRGSVERALSEDRATMTPYPPTAGHPALREAIAAHVARYRRVLCTPEQVVIVNGTRQGLNLLAQLLLERGDPVAVEDPGYPAARSTLAAYGLELSRVPVDAEGLMVEHLRTLPPQRLIHVTPSHQDPTGATLSLARRAALLDVAARTGTLIVEDDYDSEFRYEGRPVESLQGLDRHGTVVYAGTFSKSLLAGLRIGFLIAPPTLVDPIVAAKAAWDGGTSMLEQSALAHFIHSGEYERHIRRMRRLYRRRRNALLAALATHFRDRARVEAHHGGLNVLVTFHLPGSEADLAARAAAAGLALRPASPYYAQPSVDPTFVLGFGGLSEEEIEEGIIELARVCL